MKKTYRICAGTFACLLFGLLWFFSSQTGDESGELSTRIARFLMRLFGIGENANTLHKAGYIVRKAAHFNLYALFGLLLGIAFAAPPKPARVYWAFPAAILCAVIDELHQYFVSGRAAMWQDALLDSCGALTGISMLFLLLKVCKRKRR